MILYISSYFGCVSSWVSSVNRVVNHFAVSGSSILLFVKSFRVADDLSVHVFGYLASKAHSYSDNLLSVQAGEVAEDRVGARNVLKILCWR